MAKIFKILRSYVRFENCHFFFFFFKLIVLKTFVKRAHRSTRRKTDRTINQIWCVIDETIVVCDVAVVLIVGDAITYYNFNIIILKIKKVKNYKYIYTTHIRIFEKEEWNRRAWRINNDHRRMMCIYTRAYINPTAACNYFLVVEIDGYLYNTCI